MTLRRIAPIVVVLLACQAELDRRPLRPVDYAVFDPSHSLIPLPNDLVFASLGAMPMSAQKELLGAFYAAGGFPSDQEVPITVELTRATVDPGDGHTVYAAPDVDLATVNAATVALLELDETAATPVPTPVPFEASYAKNADGLRGTLTLRRPMTLGSRRWTAGRRYFVALRGGEDGVHFLGGTGEGIQPQPTFYIVREAALSEKDLTLRANQGLIPGTPAEKVAAGKQLDTLRLMYAPMLHLVAQVAGFPAAEIASLQSFEIAPSAGVVVSVDAGSGIVPLPIDLLRRPDADGKPGTVVNNPAFGPAAAGLATLDGFSTTAMILAQTSGVIDAATVPGNVALYKLNGAAAPTLVNALGTGGAPGYVAEPTPITQPCPIASGSCSTVIGLAPAVAAPVPGVGTINLPPLDEATDYAVVITNDVLDATQKPIVKSTFSKILLDVQNPVFVNGKSALSGVPNDTAAQIAAMKAKLAPVMAAIPEADRAKVVMAWTFRTQSITGTSLQLSAAPYNPAEAARFVASDPVDEPSLALIGASLPPGVQAVWRTQVPTLDAINPQTGGLQPNPALWDRTATIPALVAVPEAKAEFPSCPAPNEALKCLPLVIVHHGLGGNRLTGAHLASELAAAGFIVAAIDAPYHGSRAFCSVDTDCMTDAGATGECTASVPHAPQGGGMGVCTDGSPRLVPFVNTETGPVEMPTPSGDHFISANFFRTRDAIRQGLIDHAALTLALSRPPAPFPQPATDEFKTALAAKGIALNGEVRFLGVSLGAIIGTSIVATNPRIDRAVLNVGGGTLVDVFTNAPEFAGEVDDLFESLGIDRHDPADAALYLKTLNVAKWILDPADPLNFAQHLQGETLPNLLVPPPGAPMSPKDVLGQVATGDQFVPNPYNLLLYGVAGIDTTIFVDDAVTGGAVSHSFIGTTPEAKEQVVDYLLAPTDQPGIIHLNPAAL